MSADGGIAARLSAGQMVTLRARGGSMYPFLPDDSPVLVAPAQASGARLAVGDIVLFETVNGVVLHRIVELGKNTVLTRGDWVPHSDGARRRSEILGKAVMAVRKGRNLNLDTCAIRALGLCTARLVRLGRRLASLAG